MYCKQIYWYHVQEKSHATSWHQVEYKLSNWFSVFLSTNFDAPDMCNCVKLIRMQQSLALYESSAKASTYVHIQIVHLCQETNNQHNRMHARVCECSSNLLFQHDSTKISIIFFTHICTYVHFILSCLRIILWLTHKLVAFVYTWEYIGMFWSTSSETEYFCVHLCFEEVFYSTFGPPFYCSTQTKWIQQSFYMYENRTWPFLCVHFMA